MKADRMKRHFLIMVMGLLFAMPALAQQIPTLSPDKLALAEKLRQHLNTVKTLQGGFAQISSSGEYIDGKLYLERPGKMRLTYSAPSQTEIIVRRGSIIYHDKGDKQVTYYPLNATPLEVLLKENLSFDEDVQIVDVARGPGVIEMTLVDKEDPGMGSVTLVFSDGPLALRKWIVIDAQGIMTQVTLLNPIVGASIDEAHFQFTDPQYDKQDQ